MKLTEDQIRKIADLFGFDVETDNEGQLILYTGVIDQAVSPCEFHITMAERCINPDHSH